MKKVYLVRHGESVGNTDGKFGQPFDGPLSELGEKQAEIIARRTKSLYFDVIISSTSKRALQTGEKIREATEKKLVLSELFVERKRPSELVGRPWEDKEVKEYVRLRDLNYANPDFRYSDEEVFTDLNMRAEKALNFLEERSEENIVVTTHGIFKKFILAKVIFGENLNPESWDVILQKFHIGNTGVSELEFSDDKGWSVKVWNDQAHLAEE